MEAVRGTALRALSGSGLGPRSPFCTDEGVCGERSRRSIPAWCASALKRTEFSRAESLEEGAAWRHSVSADAQDHGERQLISSKEAPGE